MENKNCAPDQHSYDVIWNYNMETNPNIVWKPCCKNNCNHQLILPITTETLEEIKRQTKAKDDLNKLLATEAIDPIITNKIWAFLTAHSNFIGHDQKEHLKQKLNDLIISDYIADTDKQFFTTLCTLLSESDTEKLETELNNYYETNYAAIQLAASPTKGYQH